MTNSNFLNEIFSTTKSVVSKQPELLEEPGDKFKKTFFQPLSVGRLGEGGLRMKKLYKQNDTSRPLVTVITVVFNGADHLEETILSILNQTYDNIEYVLIDGGSTDGTLEIIKKYDTAIDYWISEKDGGIYDAMNKGIKLATGEWINFMNSGDILYTNEVLEKIQTKLNNFSNLVYGNAEMFSEQHHVTVPNNSSSITINSFMMNMPICHQAMFFRKKAFQQIGLFRTNYKICADHDWTVKYLYMGNQLEYISINIASCRMDGVSGTSVYQRNRERMEISLTYFPTSLWLKIYFLAIVSFFRSTTFLFFCKVNLLKIYRRFKYQL